MKISIQKALGIFVVASAILLINSCKDPLYDANKGIDTEISVGGDSLALPIGSTDTIRLGDFLSSDDMDFLKTMEDGGYGFTMSDSLSIDDILKDLDVDKLKFADQVFNQSTNVSFGDISVEDFVIPGFSTKDTMDMNIPAVELGNITPAVNMNKNFTVGFSDYALDETTLNVADIVQKTGKDNLIADLFSAYTVNVNPQFNFSTPQPIDVGNLSVSINYSIDVPEGVTNIYQIDLDAGAQLEITMQLDSVSEGLSVGEFTPNISLDPTNLFKFNIFTPLNNGLVVFDSNNKLDNFNSHSSTKTYNIDALYNLPAALNKKIDVSKLVTVTGDINASGTVKQNKVLEAKKIDLIINVSVKNVKIKNMDFDVPTFKTTLSGSSNFDINNNTIPEEIKTINTIYFGKDANSPNNTNLVIYIKPSNLPVMKVSNYKIDNLNITFPNNFAFSNLSGQTFSASNVTLDPVNGYKVELNLSEIDLSQVNITNQTLTWSGNISYSGQVSFGGRMDSEDINTANDPVLALESESAIKLNSATVTTNQIDESIGSSQVPLAFDIDIADQVARLGIINVKPGCFVRIDITKPTLPLSLKGDNIKIQFSDLYEFYPSPYLVDNALTINGDIPEYIEVQLKALHINKDLNNGTLSLKDTVEISGGVSLLSGTVSSTAIQALNDEKLIFKATVSDMGIESTSIQMKTLEASIKDSTMLNMEINDIPSEIVSLDSILLKDGANIDLEIAINNMPNLGANPLNANMVLKFPSMLEFAPGEVNANNELTINQAFVNGKLTKKVNLRGLKFDGSALNGVLKIDDKVGFDVNVSVVDPTINSDELNGEDITVNVKVTLAGLEFKSVYGRFNVDFGDQLNIPNVALDLPEMLKGDDVVLDIANPVISLATESNIGIPVDAELSFTKFKNGAPLNDDKLTFNFSLPKASSPSEFIKTGYWVSPSDAGKPAGYTYIQKDVQNLFKPVPDSLKIDLKPTINTGYQHFIDLIAKYKLKVKYDIIIPFTFGKDFSVVVTETMDSIDLGLGDLNLSAGGLELIGKITNSIPLNLNLELVIMDENSNILSTPEPQTIQAGAPDGSGVDSNFAIRLTNSGDDLAKISKIALTFRATSNSTIAGTPIKPSNFIKAELKARVIGGIKVKL
ncbi:MAG: DUF4621 domain-containing protein [Paludibacter sp.]|nr:DUF4621 domain-containing protein [Paludibacter sp.]